MSVDLCDGGNLQRSTRGASKQRRDLINLEIQRLRAVLPLSQSVRDKLFQLQVLSLSCAYIRKSLYFPPPRDRLLGLESSRCAGPPFPVAISRALSGGFLLTITEDGKLLQLSDNAGKHLGLSVDEIMCQCDSLYDLVDLRDRESVADALTSGAIDEQIAFACRMNIARPASKRHIHGYHHRQQNSKIILFRGSYRRSVSNIGGVGKVFHAFCRPLVTERGDVMKDSMEISSSVSVTDPSAFWFLCAADMSIIKAGPNCPDGLLGRHPTETTETLYQLVHPADLGTVSRIHHQIVRRRISGEVPKIALGLFRLTVDGGGHSTVWVHALIALRGSAVSVGFEIFVFCQTLSECEADALGRESVNSWLYSTELLTSDCDEKLHPRLHPHMCTEDQDAKAADCNNNNSGRDLNHYSRCGLFGSQDASPSSAFGSSSSEEVPLSSLSPSIVLTEPYLFSELTDEQYISSLLGISWHQEDV